MAKKSERDVEKIYSTKQFAVKLWRLADALESGSRFIIQVSGKRIFVPAHGGISVEHKRFEAMDEIKFQLKWDL
jgi:hypothetical protein